ncbi:MAG TPA: ParB/RepB/Spo0J family partition protein [Synergistaceae bacterium]|nr:ParB/RepB/Spo0J family partition protein [Synergistaceae bacterium]HPJ25323.1 ParB/RepB/Spo0J family partition protein [Synergistaceae bacterium]HPQ36373.1 ParB/RepB/Spo0J family partition protein [Synergistaceae bacterium]
MARKRALGKGLEALLPEMELSGPSHSPSLKVEELVPNAKQPRKEMDSDRLQELAESIRRYGVLQPIAVRRREEGTYEIIAGERRWRAAKLAGLDTIPVHMVEDPQEMSVLALIENIQREDLSAIEIASCIAALQKEKDLTQEEIAEALGWSRSGVANKIRLLQLPDFLQEMIQEGVINEGHGRTLLGLEPEEMKRVAEMIVDEDLNVRQTEMLVRRLKKGDSEKDNPEISRKDLSRELPLARNIQDRFGLKIRVEQRGENHSIKLMSLESHERDAFLEELLRSCEKLFPGK